MKEQTVFWALILTGSFLSPILAAEVDSKNAGDTAPGATCIEIFDSSTGGRIKVEPPPGTAEMVTALDSANGCFRTIAVVGEKTRLHTISFAGEVKEDRESPATFTLKHPISGRAWSQAGDVELYFDFDTKVLEGAVGPRPLTLRNYVTNKAEEIPLGKDWFVYCVEWLNPKEAILGIMGNTPDEYSIAKVNVETKTRDMVARGVPLLFAPYALSPDGRYLAFVELGAAWRQEWQELRMLDLQTKGLSVLVPGKEECSVGPLCWSPDGSSVAYVYDLRVPLPLEKAPSPREKRKIIAGLRSSAMNKEMVEAVRKSLDGPLFNIEKSINIVSPIDKQPVKALVLTDFLDVAEIKFLGAERLVCRVRTSETEKAGNGLITVINSNTRQQERQLKIPKWTRTWAAADGKTLVFDREILQPGERYRYRTDRW